MGFELNEYNLNINLKYCMSNPILSNVGSPCLIYIGYLFKDIYHKQDWKFVKKKFKVWKVMNKSIRPNLPILVNVILNVKLWWLKS
jgi:hypothetical protein